MCMRLSERAADDLIRIVKRAGKGDFSMSLESAARAVLAKHDLLTPADDPEVAAVFMEEEPAKERHKRQRCICDPGDACDYHAALGHGSVADVPHLRGITLESARDRHAQKRVGSPSRFHYSETKE